MKVCGSKGQQLYIGDRVKLTEDHPPLSRETEGAVLFFLSEQEVQILPLDGEGTEIVPASILETSHSDLAELLNLAPEDLDAFIEAQAAELAKQAESKASKRAPRGTGSSKKKQAAIELSSEGL